MVNIEINGIKLEARDGAMVIEVADEAGIVIPRFCYHKKLSIAANCRMCLVEVEKVAKPLPACATPVTEGMKVFTHSPKALGAQRAVLEFLLINHPLDCPICDQGGECDLQEMAIGFGGDVSRYAEGKRVVTDPDLGALIATDMGRCIHCTRCVRFGQEVAGMWELGGTGRGEHTRIGTYVADTVDSELSANVVDLCPVGALTSKPYRYSGRPWELVGRPGISPHDCVGANLRADIRGKQIMRVLPQEREEINETWLADRDRFAYLGGRSAERITAPMVKRETGWQATDWDSALTFAAEGLKRVLDVHGPSQLGAWVGDTATVEEAYLTQKLMRALGSGNVDHRLRQVDFRDQEQLPAFPYLGMAIADLERLDGALLIGSNIRKEQPLLGQRLRKAALRGGQIAFINPRAYPFNFPVSQQIVAAHNWVTEVAAVARAALALAGEEIPEGLPEAEVGEAHEAIAAALRSGEQRAVLLGNLAAYHPAQTELRAMAALIARSCGAHFGVLAEGGNSAGAWLAGAVPHRGMAAQPTAVMGRDWRSMAHEGVKGLLLLSTEPESDCIEPLRATQALKQADFVVAINAFASDAARDYADVILPPALYLEAAGTLVNCEGRWQSFEGTTPPPGEARPAWKLLRVLGNLLNAIGFEQLSITDVRDELAPALAVGADNQIPWRVPAPPSFEGGIMRLVDYPIYSVDGLVRRSAPLQQTRDAIAGAVYVAGATLTQVDLGGADRVRVMQGEGEALLPVIVDEAIPVGCVYIPAGTTATAALGGGFGVVEMTHA